MKTGIFHKSLKNILLLSCAFLCTEGIFAQKINKSGGGYAVTSQIPNTGYSCQIYNAENGLPTSDANFVMGSSDGHIWIGGYAGIIKYDGTVFERLPVTDGLTSGRGFFEDSKKRIWVATNDNGVAVINGNETRHYTYKDGLPSSSIRTFAEDEDGNIFIGTTSGIAYFNSHGQLKNLFDERIDKERILKLDSDSAGNVYGQTKNGGIFSIKDCKIDKFYTGKALGMGKITSLLADPENEEKVYLGTENSDVYYCNFGDDVSKALRINVSPLKNVHWMSWDCSRVWISSTTRIGFLDEKNKFHELTDIPMSSSIEMTASDYQGNIWIASSTQGVMKIVTNNFVDLTNHSELEKETVNANCIYEGKLYIGTDNGLKILDENNRIVKDSLTEYIGNTRIRCIIVDKSGNLWIATYTNNMGLIYRKKDGTITAFTTKNGLLNNQVRSLHALDDGRILAGTNGGLAVIKNGSVTETYGTANGINNSEFLTVCEGINGSYYCGSDGDGIYLINQNGTERISRDEGLTSDVIMRIKKDEKHGVFWVITSNSIQYIKNGRIKNVKSFPYSNNYDIYINSNDEAWILSSCGIFTVNTEDLLADSVNDYRVYTLSNGLPCQITSNSYSTLEDDGTLYISGRQGIICVETENFYKEENEIKLGVNSIYCDGKKILAGQNETYFLPPTKGRIKLSASVMDYTLENPYVRVFLEGAEDSGIVMHRDALTPLEYTSLPYGSHTLHIQILNNSLTKIRYEKTFEIEKKPQFWEIKSIRNMIAILIIIFAGLIVWIILRSTVISRQYSEIKKAKENAELANTAKSRFLSNMSREIITPINTICGMDEMIMREDAKDVPKGYFMSIMNYAFDIKNAVETLQTLVTDLFELTKIETDSMELIETEYDVQEMLRSVIAPVRARTAEKALKFDVIIDEIIPQRLYGDVGKIRQVILKLLTNAVKFTEEGGIELRFTMEDRNNNVCGLCFTVKDTGTGIKQEDVEKLFTAYNENSVHVKTGLGLDISRRFAELMGGVLVCRSTYGEGSEFIFTLTQKIADSTPIGPFMEFDDGKSARGPYIPQFIAPDADVLIADDNMMNITVFRNLLKATKVFVNTATNAEKCLEKIRMNSFNIAFISQSIVESAGDEMITKIRETRPELKIYIITENTRFGEESYKQQGFTGSISNPIDGFNLERIIMRNLPEQMMEIPNKGDFTEKITEWPEELLWIKNVDGISSDEGEKASGGIESLLFGLNLFYETINEQASLIDGAYKKGDFKLLEMKIELLKNSARLIGAGKLYDLSVKLKEACEKNDRIYIASHIDEILDYYKKFKEKLSRLQNPTTQSEPAKEM